MWDCLQVIYNEQKHPRFWKLVKELKLDRGGGGIVLIMAAAYGSNPVRGLAEDYLVTPAKIELNQRAGLRYFCCFGPRPYTAAGFPADSS